jgi:hypothetical protein
MIPAENYISIVEFGGEEGTLLSGNCKECLCNVQEKVRTLEVKAHMYTFLSFLQFWI